MGICKIESDRSAEVSVDGRHRVAKTIPRDGT